MTAGGPEDWLDPRADGAWPANVGACATTRAGAPGSGFDLGGSAPPSSIAARRAVLAERLGVRRICFLNQVHGVRVLDVDASGAPADSEADAAVTARPQVALAILTADCLPVLFADRAGSRVAAAHAGWRGLAGGVLEATVAALERPPEEILAWLGPAIGPAAFEVGPEVREAMISAPTSAASAAALAPAMRPGRADRWHVDLAAVAAARLEALGVGTVLRSGTDSHGDPARFYSYRRDGGRTGRQAALVWLRAAGSSERGRSGIGGPR